MNLFHFSEESSIEVFVPRVKENRTDMPPVVWAIDEEHEYTFYFPRDCPRIVYSRTDEINEEDRARFFGLSDSERIITVETGWYERIKNTTLYRYTFPADTFRLFDACAGYYISTETVKPLSVEPLDHLLDRLISLNVEIRFTPSLHPLRNALVNSSVQDFGIHRFANAQSHPL
ncbi:DUF6886 family protein [Paenibacillus rigui]|uniref:Uncharacterized protein n=1 Tax=Paenibacillus rigui TaxID=554312 RepID=A0A229USG6_9BACL|nr:DUF6886 family protein [Paenibacillus rigui]OXM86191.1 hypothetical protein CF651_13355 [Paenibacillus rigui]